MTRVPKPLESNQIQPAPFSRRQMLQMTSAGFGYLAFTGLLAESQAAYQSPLLPRPPHFKGKAKHVIFMCMQGGPSHLDTFDYKPKLASDAGKSGDKGKLVAPAFTFRRRGMSGLWISDAFPKIAQHADELCLLRGMNTDIPNHPQAFIQLHTGNFQFVRPSLGAWTLYGLGTENKNLPGFITINPPVAGGGAQNYGSSFLPAVFQGTAIGGGEAGAGGKKAGSSGGIGNISNSHLSAAIQRKQVELLQNMNDKMLVDGQPNTQIEGVIESYELAFRMQGEVPKIMDFSSESKATLDLYGIGKGDTDGFGRQCLMARRFVESGVRFVEISHGGWDQHRTLQKSLGANARATDQPMAALITDLKQRGLLNDTLIIWGGEFGRTPGNGSPDGRGHNSKGYTMWMAGGGVKGGLSYGETDDYGGKAVINPTHVHDLHATILALLGLDHQRLTFKYAGRDFRLTNVSGKVARDIIA